MKNGITVLLAVLASAATITACNHEPGGGSVAVIDLAAVARATGQDELMRQRAEEGRMELTTQLQTLAADLDRQLVEERDKVGDKPSEEDSARLQQMNAQARQQITQAQQQAQQQANQLESTLVFEFRDALMPLAEKAARDLGATVILSDDAYIFWADESLDITATVIAAWQAANPEAAATEAGTEAPAAAE